MVLLVNVYDTGQLIKITRPLVVIYFQILVLMVDLVALNIFLKMLIMPKKTIPVFSLTRPPLRFRADSAIFIAILKKKIYIYILFTYRPFFLYKNTCQN